MPGTLVITTLSDGTNSTSATNPIQGSAKAWVRFTMVVTSPAVATSYNVTSITYNAAGDYTINIAAGALADGNYAPIASAQTAGGNRAVSLNQYNITTPTATSCRMKYYDSASGQVDPNTQGYVAFFR